MTNDLVTGNENCLELVEKTLELTDSKIFDGLRHIPRKSLESAAIVIFTTEGRCLMYFPREDLWCEKEPLQLEGMTSIFFCHDKMYCTRREPARISYPLHSMFQSTFKRMYVVTIIR